MAKQRITGWTPNGPAIAAIRTRSGLTQRTLAARIGVHYSLIAQVETNRSGCGTDVLVSIAAELEVPIEAIASPPTEVVA